LLGIISHKIPVLEMLKRITKCQTWQTRLQAIAMTARIPAANKFLSQKMEKSNPGTKEQQFKISRIVNKCDCKHQLNLNMLNSTTVILNGVPNLSRFCYCKIEARRRCKLINMKLKSNNYVTCPLRCTQKYPFKNVINLKKSSFDPVTPQHTPSEYIQNFP
jgi:hypothetical protein